MVLSKALDTRRYVEARMLYNALGGLKRDAALTRGGKSFLSGMFSSNTI